MPPSPASSSTKLDLNAEFTQLIDLLENSQRSLFITGKAGTGKSTLLQYFRDNSKKNVAVVSPTGLSALNVGGQTIHSFFRIAPGIVDEQAISPIRRNRMYKEIDTIVIDEVSMVRADLLDGIDIFMRLNGRNAALPFGGVQVILFGDLFQLPPIVSRDEQEILSHRYDSPYFFSANVIQDIMLDTHEMTQVYRQTDMDFIHLLNQIRTGSAEQDHLNTLNEQAVPSLDPEVERNCVMLVTTNAVANNINQRKLAALPGLSKVYRGDIDGDFKSNDRNLPTDLHLNLKVGAKIIFVKNDMEGRWVNGTLGIITAIENESIRVTIDDDGFPKLVNVERATWEKVKYTYDADNDRVHPDTVGTYTQLPVKLAWAITIHKSQGQTFNDVYVDFSNGTFAPGQAYVALSRCRRLQGLYLKRPMRLSDILVDSRIVQFYRSLAAQ